MKLSSSKTIKTALFFSLLFIAASCSKEPSCLIDCNQGTQTEDCTCDCPEGIEGDHCEFLWRDKVIGEWNLASLCGNTGATINFKVNINEDPIDNTKFHIAWDINELNTMYMMSSTEISMPPQAACATCWVVEGDGEIKEDGTMVINIENPQYKCEWTLFR